MGHFKSVSLIQDVQSVVIFVTCFFSFYNIQKLQLGKRLTIQIWQMKVLQINMYHVLLVVNVVDMKCLPTYMEIIIFFFFGGGENRIFFLTTILLLKVAKRWLFVKKMTLEPYFSSGTWVITISDMRELLKICMTWRIPTKAYKI